MKLMLAAFENPWRVRPEVFQYQVHSEYLLASYYYLKGKEPTEMTELFRLRNETDDFMLDSGAFTLKTTQKGITDEDLYDYITGYIEFVRTNKIKRYIEIDIDKQIGYNKVLEIRERLEKEVGWAPVPVYHPNMPISEFKDMVDRYDYICIGGLQDSTIGNHEREKVKLLNRYAKQRNCKTHGLGFTSAGFYNYGFYSVDSTSWKSGVRYGQIAKFRDGKIVHIKKPDNTKADNLLAETNNLVEWLKLQQYAKRISW